MSDNWSTEYKAKIAEDLISAKDDALYWQQRSAHFAAKHAALVEAVKVLMRDEILNDFDGGYLAHHEWVRRYAEQVGSVQDALAAQEEA